VDQVTQIDMPEVLQTSDALARLSTRLTDVLPGLIREAWHPVEGSETDRATSAVAEQHTKDLTVIAEEILDLSRALYAAGTGFRTSDDAGARRLDRAQQRGF
jgi:hypothetical protein